MGEFQWGRLHEKRNKGGQMTGETCNDEKTDKGSLKQRAFSNIAKGGACLQKTLL